MTPELLTITEFCTHANIGRTNLYHRISKGQIKAVKLGKKTLIPKTEMLRWIENLQPYPTKGEDKNAN